MWTKHTIHPTLKKAHTVKDASRRTHMSVITLLLSECTYCSLDKQRQTQTCIWEHVLSCQIYPCAGFFPVQQLQSESMHCKTHVSYEYTYTHTAVGRVFPLQGKQILLCRVRTKLNALTRVAASCCFVTWPPLWGRAQRKWRIKLLRGPKLPREKNSHTQMQKKMGEKKQTAWWSTFVIAQYCSYQIMMDTCLPQAAKSCPLSCLPNGVRSDFSFIGRLRFSRLRLCRDLRHISISVLFTDVITSLALTVTIFLTEAELHKNSELESVLCYHNNRELSYHKLWHNCTLHPQGNTVYEDHIYSALWGHS